jgi:hypothetical protein
MLEEGIVSMCDIYLQTFFVSDFTVVGIFCFPLNIITHFRYSCIKYYELSLKYFFHKETLIRLKRLCFYISHLLIKYLSSCILDIHLSDA